MLLISPPPPSPYVPPSVFALVKWKTDENSTQVVVKWQDVVSFGSHLRKGWSGLVGRCLQLLIQELTMAS